MNKHKGNSIKHVKTIASEKKTKESRKSEVESADSPSFLGLSDERKQKHKQKNDENQMKNPNPNRENREKRATERSFLFFFFVCLDRRENKYIERINIKRGINLIYKGEQYDE